MDELREQVERVLALQEQTRAVRGAQEQLGWQAVYEPRVYEHPRPSRPRLVDKPKPPFLDGGLMLYPKGSRCLVERELWNLLRKLERKLHLDAYWITYEEEHADEHRFIVNPGAFWALGQCGAAAGWFVEGRQIREHPSLDVYDNAH